MNEIELILQEKADIFANFIKRHTISFLEKCTDQWFQKTWQENGDTTISFNDFKRGFLPNNTQNKYLYNGFRTPGPKIMLAEVTRFSLIGWRHTDGVPETKLLLAFDIIPTTQRIQILGMWDTEAEALYRYLLEQIAKAYPDVPSAAATSIGINISDISSAGNVNINLYNVAGHDQISATPLPVSTTYQELLEDGIKLLKSLLYDKAIDKLRKAAELDDAETKAHYYLAIALLKGRSFNSSSLHPKTRNEIEKHLKHAHINNPNWLPPFVFLAVMEIEYHNLHGTPNKNVVIDDVIKMMKQQELSPEDSLLLNSCSLKERTKRRLHLTS